MSNETVVPTPFDLLYAYLKGEEDVLNRLNSTLKPQCTPEKNALAIYKNTTVTPNQTQTLRKVLGVPNDATLQSTDNLLDLIDNLNKAGYGYGQLADFRHQLKQIYTKPDWSGALLFTTLFTGIISAFFFLNKQQLDRFEKLLTRIAPFIAPLFLIGFQIYTIIQQAYKTRYEDTYHSDNHRARRWLVGTLPSLLNLSAYVAIAIIGSMSPLAAALFVGASFVGVFDGALSFYYLSKAEQQQEPGTASAIRQNNRKERVGQTLQVKMYAAIGLSATVAISCLFPPSIFVILSCVTLFILIPQTKNMFLDNIHTDSSNALLTQLNQCKDKHNYPHVEPPTIQLSEDNDEPLNKNRLTRSASWPQVTQPYQLSFFNRPDSTNVATQTISEDTSNNALEDSLSSSHR